MRGLADCSLAVDLLLREYPRGELGRPGCIPKSIPGNNAEVIQGKWLRLAINPSFLLRNLVTEG
jgi:hypothetical protein